MVHRGWCRKVHPEFKVGPEGPWDIVLQSTGRSKSGWWVAFWDSRFFSSRRVARRFLSGASEERRTEVVVVSRTDDRRQTVSEVSDGQVTSRRWPRSADTLVSVRSGGGPGSLVSLGRRKWRRGVGLGSLVTSIFSWRGVFWIVLQKVINL